MAYKASSASSACPICRSPSRAVVDLLLAGDDRPSPRRVARMIPGFSRAQIAAHRRTCLLGAPRWINALRTGRRTPEDLRQALQEKGIPEEDVTQIVAAAGSTAGGTNPSKEGEG